MRHALLLAASAFALAAAPSVTAQDDACSEQSPCTWVVDVDADGIIDAPAGGWNFTAGDWLVLDMFNFDEAASHRITVTGVGIDETVGPVDGATAGPFRFEEAGTYALRDAPSGDEVAVHVWALDLVEVEEGGAGDDADATAADGDAADGARDTPGSALPLACLALLGVASCARRPS